jgi:predicted transcriptional regulator
MFAVISQFPGRPQRRGRLAGRRDRLELVFRNPDALHEDVVEAMQSPLATIEAGTTFDEVFATLTGRTNAIVVARRDKPLGVLTRSDILEYLAHRHT